MKFKPWGKRICSKSLNSLKRVSAFDSLINSKSIKPIRAQAIFPSSKAFRIYRGVKRVCCVLFEETTGHKHK